MKVEDEISLQSYLDLRKKASYIYVKRRNEQKEECRTKEEALVMTKCEVS